MSGHTPGPWIVHERLYPYRDGSKFHVERTIHTQYIHPQLKGLFPVVCLSVGIGMKAEEIISFVRIEEADAHLIAAAPSMLTELHKARAALQEHLDELIESHTLKYTGLIESPAAQLIIESQQDLINGIDRVIAQAEGHAPT